MPHMSIRITEAFQISDEMSLKTKKGLLLLVPNSILDQIITKNDYGFQFQK